MSYKFYTHNNIVFGRDSLKQLPEVIANERISHLMFFHGSSCKRAGIVAQIMDILSILPLEITIYDKVIPNPTNIQVEEAAEIAKRSGVDGFLAVGGGSSIDLAKAVNVLMTNPGKISDYAGIGTLKEKVLPFIAIPTTTGTSSEVTNVSALIDTEKVCKYVVKDDKLIPSAVICDPALTVTMPKSVAAATGMDAITHAVESYVSKLATPLSKYNSLKGLQILYENMEASYQDGSNLELRENLMLGCIITGDGFSNANLGLVHGIAHTLSAHYNMSHGLANACVLPFVLKYNAPSCKKEMIEMAQAIGLQVSGNEETDMYLLADAIGELGRRLDIQSLSAYGVPEQDLAMLADETLMEPVLNFNPRQGITHEDVLSILKEAF